MTSVGLGSGFGWMQDHQLPKTLDGVTYRRATLEDRDALFAFAREAYPQNWQFRIPERWQWLYLDNPYIHDGKLPIWIALLENGRIIGQTNAILEPLSLDGQDRCIGWLCSATTLPAYRRRGIGLILENLNSSYQDVSGRVGMPGNMRRNMVRLGGVPIDTIQRFERQLNFDGELVNAALTHRLAPGSSIRRFAGGFFRGSGMDRLVAALLNLKIPKHDTLWNGADQHVVTLREFDRFGQETDRLWEKVGPCYEVAIRRDATFCNWKFVDQPHMYHRRWMAWRDGEPCGFIVLRVARQRYWRLGIVTELFTAPDDEYTIRALLTLTLNHFLTQGVHKLVAATSVSTIRRCLQQAGFRTTTQVLPMFYAKPGCEAALKPGAWFLGKSDCDEDQFPPGTPDLA